jgi:hypothetical protein
LGRDGNKRGDKLYDETQQVRIRAKNPMIERKPSDREDSATSAAEPKPASIYEQIEQTDRTEEIQLAAKELAALAREPLPLAETKELVVRERPPEPPKKRKKSKRAKRGPSPPVITEVEPPKELPTKPIVYPAPVLDEDETIVAKERPQRAGDLQREHDPRFAAERHQPLSDSDEVPTYIPAKRGGEGAIAVKRSTAPRPPEEPTQKAKDPVPQRMVGGGGTHAAGAEVHRQMVDRIDRELPDVSAPALRMLRGELDPTALRILDEALAGRFDAKGVDSSVSPKRTLEHLINEKGTNALPVKDRAALLGVVAQSPQDLATTKACIAISKTRVLERLRDGERSKLLDVLRRLDVDGRATLAQLAARQVRQRSALEDRDLREIGMVERLSELSDDRALPEELRGRGITRESVVGLVLAALANPAKLSLEEGSAGVLSTIEFALADTAPAEYARLWCELVSRFCSAELAGEGRLDLGRRLASDVELSNQSTPLRFALEQLAELAHPRPKSPATDFVMPGGQGIDADVLSRALSMIWGVGYTVAAGAENAVRHLLRVSKDPQRTPPVFVSISYERGERLFVFDHLEDDTVYFRAPHGRSTKKNGAFRTDPMRAVVDADRGIESVARSEFESSAGVGLIPR